MSERESIIAELEREYTEPIRDPLWKHIYLSRGMLSLIDREPFLKLGRIRQLGAAYLVYPGATHTRLNHSLGVFHVARRVLRSLLAFADAPDFTREGVRAFLCASLLHDLGHFPFAHSLKELPLKEHEVLTGEMICAQPLRSLIRERVGTDPQAVAAIVDHEIPIEGNDEIRRYRNILSGVLDPDKLDYLNRDAYFCGVSYGIQDIDFIINRILPHPVKGIALEAGGLVAVENLLFSKYLMYRTVYWHRTVRIATAMIRKAVVQALFSGEIRPEQLYGLDDQEFFAFCEASPFPAFRLTERVSRRQLHKTAAEFPFDPENPRHASLTDLTTRIEHEREIARELSGLVGRTVPEEEVIIDVPEPISFEIDIPVRDREHIRPYAETDTVFTPQAVREFTRALRRIRLILPPDIAAEIDLSKDPYRWI